MAEVTHARWRNSTRAAYDELTKILAPAVGHMNTDLASSTVRAGVTQRRLTAKWPGLLGELGAQGARVVGAHDPRLTRVSEAQARAGGQAEVYGNKRASRY